MNIRERDPKVKQGSKATAVSEAEEVYLLMKDHADTALHTYQTLLERGVAPEVARSVLPQGMFSEFIETGSLAAYARICHLRLDPSAQKEIRDYANAVHECMIGLFPVSWEALMAV
jgi:thymidylate synthase (FAD)